MGNTYLLNALRKLKFGVGSIMVWGMISSAGVGPIVRFHGNINDSVYKEHLIPYLRKGRVETLIFMQDNMPCHKAKSFEDEGLDVMKCHHKAQI